ncbi:MAG: CHASE3 domain-containing protein [Terracidiphilus sp.]|jgi:PAS domain S-box-containing protein
MQIFNKRIGVIVGFSFLLVLSIVNTAVTRYKLVLQNGAESWVFHTHQVLIELNQLELLLLDAESGKRGYLYTGDGVYLAHYQEAIAKIEPRIDTIARLTADNPRQQANIPELRRRVHAKVAEMAQVIALYQSGKTNEARELVITSTGMGVMDQVHFTIAEMEMEETRLESLRVTAYESTIRQTIASIYLANILAAFGLVLLAYYILREMGLREKHAQELRAREEWLRVTLTSIGDAVIVTDKKGSVVFLNPIAETLTGNPLTKAVDRNILEVFPIVNEYTGEAVENPIKKVLEMGGIAGLANHTVLLRKDGVRVPIEDSAAPIHDTQGKLLGVVLVFRDVTKDRKAADAMRKAEKLAAVGRLSATLAHEINNPLQAVAGLVYLSRTAQGLPNEVEKQLSLAEAELQRVANVVQQTLGFHREPRATDLVDMPALIESAIALYSNKLKSKMIRLERHFGDCPRLRAASGELRQAISNLLANAADAVDNQGTIIITLKSLEQTGQPMLQILVEDDGPGISPDERRRLFEPFFTTKKDIGTGLGLWLTKEIVERHDGKIEDVPHADGRPGATFSILLPISANPSQDVSEGGEAEAIQSSEQGRCIENQNRRQTEQ